MNGAPEAFPAIGVGRRRRSTAFWLGVLPPLAAALYPIPLAVFHASFLDASHGDVVAATLATFALPLAFLMPLFAWLAAARLLRDTPVTALQRRARRVALFSVSAPAWFVVVGVFTYVAGVAVWDRWLLAAFWLALAAWVAVADDERRLAEPVPSGRASASARARWLQASHGVAALVFIGAFLAWHLGNHLLGLLGGDVHKAVMHVLRQFYRSTIVEPALLATGVFLIGSGLVLAWRAASRPSDLIRSLQLATGLYLAIAIPSHVNSALYFARTFLKIESDWDFAVGAPTGLLADPWNIRLVPYYALLVAAVVTHACCGLRVVLAAHGVSETAGRRVVIGGAGFGIVLATAILLGMCGVRL